MKLRRRRPIERQQRQRVQPRATPAYRARQRPTEAEVAAQLPSGSLASSARRVLLFWFQRLGLLVLLVAVLASLVNILSLSDQAKIVPLTTNASQPLLQPSSIYAQAASHSLGNSIWNRNKVTINSGQVSRQLMNQFPELSSVSITVPLLAHQPIVYVEPAQPTLILVAANGAFVIGSTGKALLKAATPAGLNLPRLPVVTDQSGLSASLGHQALPSTSVGFIQTVIGQLAAKQYSVSGLVLPASSSELDIQLAGQPYLVKFNLQSADARGEAGTFLATITQLHRQNVTPASYVDVRVQGRAYYK